MQQTVESCTHACHLVFQISIYLGILGNCHSVQMHWFPWLHFVRSSEDGHKPNHIVGEVLHMDRKFNTDVNI
jgi:hypothetical protein